MIGRFGASLLVGVSALACSSIAWAADATAVQATGGAADQPSEAAGTAPTAAPATEAPAGDIVVTGSRVIKNGNASPTPVTVVTTESLNAIRPAATISDQLNTIPVFNGSRQATSFGRGTGLTGGGNGTANQLNLRNVGSNRNLILMDGRRVPPSTSLNVVDADVIPSMLVQRVDTVTGGVSAVYGSDAVSGVVNFVIDRNFNGILAQANTGISRYGDARQVNAGVAAGTKVGDRGHFEFSYEFRDDKGVNSRASRPWFTQASVGGAGTVASPGIVIEGGRLPLLPFGGRINSITCPTGVTCTFNPTLANGYFATDGVIGTFNRGTAVNNGTTLSGIEIGGDGGYYDSSLKATLRMNQLFARFDYDVADDVHFYAYGTANFKKSTSFVQTLTLNAVTLSATNPFLSPAVRSLLGPATTFSFGRIITGPGETREGYKSTAKQMIGVVGLEGKLGGADWNIAYNHGHSTLKTLMLNNVNQQKLAAALDPVLQGGSIVCSINADAITTNNDAACVPLNPFGATATTPEMLSYFLAPGHFRFDTRVHDVVGEVSGSPFDTWAGPVELALSGEWRRLIAWSSSDTLPSMLQNCSGITRNCSATTPVWRQSFAQMDRKQQSVWEVAGEAQVPLLRDFVLAKSLSVSGAVRYTDYYDSVGSYWTWKAGLSWEVNDDLRVRGTLSRDIRAPTVNDLYSPQTVSFTTQQDLLVNQSVNRPFIQISNPNLTAEIGKTKTVGLVYRPRFLPGVSAAIDYYEIKIVNAITQVSGVTPAFQQLCYASGGSSIYCQLQTRPLNYTTRDPATNTVISWLNQPINIGSLETKGVDFELNYSGRLGGRVLTLRGLAAYQPHIRFIQPGAPIFDLAGAAFGNSGQNAAPKWRLTGLASYQATDQIRVDLQYRWRSTLQPSSDPTFVWTGPYKVGPFGQLAANLNFQVPTDRLQKLEFYFNVQNVLDAKPQPTNSTGSVGSPGFNNGWAITDDPIGRYYTFGARVKF